MLLCFSLVVSVHAAATFVNTLNERKFVVVGERNAYLCNIDGDVSTRFGEATP